MRQPPCMVDECCQEHSLGGVTLVDEGGMKSFVAYQPWMNYVFFSRVLVH